MNLEAKADRLAAAGQPDAAARHHHQLWLGLTSEQEAELKQAAADWARQNAPLDTQAGYARTVLRQLRRESPGAATAAQEQGLAAIAAQQVALAQSGEDRLAKAFGPAPFIYFESILRRYAVSKAPTALRPQECGEQQCLVPSGESSQLDATLDWTNLSFGGPYFGGAYEGILSAPGGTDFTGRTVGEGFPGATTDTCYAQYPSAGVLPFDFSAVPNTLWLVGTEFQTSAPLASNHYGTDYVFWNSYSVLAYIQGPMQQAASQGASNPSCSASASQWMYIDDCTPGEINYSGAPYQTNPLAVTITYNVLTTCAYRAGLSACSFVY